MSRTLPGPASYLVGWVHAVLGGAVWLLPAALGVVASAVVPEPARFGVFVATTVALVVVSGLFRVSRAVSVRLGNALLATRIPAMTLDGGWPGRLRSAGWMMLHAALGGALLALALQALFAAVALPAIWLGGGGDDATFYGASPTVGNGWSGSWTVPAALMLVALVVLAGVGYAALLRRAAPSLLGPGAAERIAAVQRHADQLAHRNRLARELHDSIGHTLTAATIQAAVASTLVDSDPAGARRTMNSIEESSRATLEDLDHALGVLREGASLREPQYALDDLGPLLDRVRHAGTPVDAEVTGEPERVPATVSREAYRIVQEGLTNAMRHPGPVIVRIDVGPDRLVVDLTNPIAADPPTDLDATRGGRGLAGISERVHVLRGEVSAGPVTDDTGRHWRLSAWLPLRSAP